MIVIGVDVHKHSLTAVAVDELGRTLAERTGQVEQELVDWARSLSEARLWALEDCRHVTRALERTLQDHGERLVRVPPRLTAPQRRRGRTRGKSDAIDALAIARAAHHRDDLVDERRRCQQRLRWHLHELDPGLQAPLGALDRAVWLDRLSRQLARREQTTQARIARELIVRCRSLNRSIAELERELQQRTTTIAPRLLALPAAERSAPRSCSARSARSTASAQTPSSPAMPASHRSTPAPANTNATASTVAGTDNSTARCTGSP
jgi:transposase